MGRPVAETRHTGLERTARDEVEAIRTLLADVYQDAGDGRTLIRELVQNADDARASKLVFSVVDRGWTNAENSLLSGPALVVANDGPFSERDHAGLHRAIGGSKRGEAGKVGRFGVGMKSIFHLCEAFVYLGAEGGTLRPGVLNPWTGISGEDHDPIHPDWDTFTDQDRRRIEQLGENLLGGFDEGFVQWIPLRRRDHIDRGAEGEFGLATKCWEPSAVADWFATLDSIATLLAQCGYLCAIEVNRTSDLGQNRPARRLCLLERPAFEREEWVGRPSDDQLPTSPRSFYGVVEGSDDQSSTKTWHVRGVEHIGHEELLLLKKDQRWPKDDIWKNGRHSLERRKALAHAAVTLVRSTPATAQERGAVRLRWATFLPLDDDPAPAEGNPVVETRELLDGARGSIFDIILHGYFWPAHDRRSIPGVTERGRQEDIREQWNQAVRDKLLLPLVPQALSEVASEVPAEVAESLVRAVAKSAIVTRHLPQVTERHVLLPVVTEQGVRWELRETGVGARILSVPGWSDAPASVRRQFTALPRDPDCSFIDGELGRVSRELSEWSVHDLERLLGCIPAESLQTQQGLDWVTRVLSHVGVRADDGNEALAAAVAGWIAERVGQGAFVEGLREHWRDIVAKLPERWVLPCPVGSLPAVVELSKEGAFGEGLLPVPVGRSNASGSRPDADRVDAALLRLGQLLRCDGPPSKREARLFLAEALLSMRERAVDGQLAELPLLRATRQPANEKEAWSVRTLQDKAADGKVFCGALDRTDAGPGSGGFQTRDYAQAARALAHALGCDVWLVDAAVAPLADVPAPGSQELADAVAPHAHVPPPRSQEQPHPLVIAHVLRSSPSERLKLIERLAREERPGARLRDALRVLLTGRSHDAGHEDLLYVRSDDSERDESRRSLRLLLMVLGQPWRQIEAELVEVLPTGLSTQLGIRAFDQGIFKNLLSVALGRAAWAELDADDAVHILQHAHAADRDLWARLPLHRFEGGKRGPIDAETRRAGPADVPEHLRSEIRLVDPDPAIPEFYAHLRPLDDDGVLALILGSERPWSCVHDIAALLNQADGRCFLPRDAALRTLLETQPWLPAEGGKAGIAPDRLLLLPETVRAHVRPLATAGALGEYWLPDAVDAGMWGEIEPVIGALRPNESVSTQLQGLAGALQNAPLESVEDGAFVVATDPSTVTPALVGDVLQTALARDHAGWALVEAAQRSTGGGKRIESVIAELAQSLCGSMSAARQRQLLESVSASRPPKDSQAGQVFLGLLETLAPSPGFMTEVLPHLELPTQDGNWHVAEQVAVTATGVARRHRALSEVRRALGLDGGRIEKVAPGETVKGGHGTAGRLREYFTPWKGRVPNAAVGAFLALWGEESPNVAALAQEWLGADVSAQSVRNELAGVRDSEFWQDLKVYVPGVVGGAHVTTKNVLGYPTKMAVDADIATLFAEDPCHKLGARYYWEVKLRQLQPAELTSAALLELLRESAKLWVQKIEAGGDAKIDEWWRRWAETSQAEIQPVVSSIVAHLPLTLHQLGIRDSPALVEAVRKADHTQRRREQAPRDQLQRASAAERRALRELAELVRSEAQRDFVWKRVQRRMRDYGYRPDSVLLELAQNADDALEQAAEIAAGPLPPAACRLVVRVHDAGGEPALDITHYGRPINETGGRMVGRDRQWDQDLYFMMLLNLSGKPGEGASRTSGSSTTGRFGLGFKSVHLVSAAPSVASGFLAFSIDGGLLPREVPRPTDLDEVNGRPATRVRLPLRDPEPEELLEEIFCRFRYGRSLLPVFARRLQDVVVEGGPSPGRSTFDGRPIKGAVSWEVSGTAVEVADARRLRILRFRPPGGTAAVAFGLNPRTGIPEPFPPEVPFLWNVAPTSEGWGCGYAINGPFKLDPGRTHVSLDDERTKDVVDGLGVALGKGFLHLHDALAQGAGAQVGLPTGGQVPDFFGRLWELVAPQLNQSDQLRKELLHALHCGGRGASHWIDARAVVPTEMPAPFAPILPALAEVERIAVAGGGLEQRELCAAFSQIEDLAQLCAEQRVVSREVAERLLTFAHKTREPLRPARLLHLLAEAWDHELTSQRLHSLRPLAEPRVWRLVDPAGPDDEWSTPLRARTADGTLEELRLLLLPPGCDVEQPHAFHEELLRSDFAPASSVLAAEYIEEAGDAALFRKLRGPHAVNAKRMARWFRSEIDQSRYPEALRYLLHGELRDQILDELTSDLPYWLADFEAIRELLHKEVEPGDGRAAALLARLFPDRMGGLFAGATGVIEAGAADHDEPADEAPIEVLPEVEAQDFIVRFHNWWADERIRRRVIQKHEETAWPEALRKDLGSKLRDGSRDHWLALLVLGACQSLGRTSAHQHRGFLLMTRDAGWWDVFQDAGPAPDELWMAVLREYQDQKTLELDYSKWMSLFPTIYQLTRHLPKYERLLRTAGRRREDQYQVRLLLAPRVDDALSGAGHQFDAPPAPMGIGLHWVLRELVRLDVVNGEHLYPDCWVPNDRVLGCLQRIGMKRPDTSSNYEKAEAISNFVSERLGPEARHLYRCFDIPLRHLLDDEALQRQLGYKTGP